MRSVVWVHEEMLRANHPIFVVHPVAPAIWIWDDADLRRSPMSMKRVILHHQELAEMPVSVLHGDTVTELLRFAVEHGANRISTADSSNPRVRVLLDRLASRITLERLPASELEGYQGHLDVRDFARYWRSVRPMSEVADEESTQM